MGGRSIFPNRPKDATKETDRRNGPRFGLFSFVEICDSAGEPIVEATIRDLSDNGAHLHVKTTAEIPEKLIVRSSLGQNSYAARLRWISGADIGVEFDEVLRARSDY